MGAGLLPGDVEAPPPHEPLQDLARLHRQVRTPQGLGRTCALRIADEPPAPGQGRHPSVRPHRGVRAPLDHPLALTIPATHRHGWPASGRVGQDVGPGRQPRALQAGATRLPRCPRRRGFLPCRIQTQTGEATEGIRQLAPAPPQRHDGEAALGDEPEAALWYPAPPHQEPVSGPIGQLLVPLAPFLRGALGRRHYRPAHGMGTSRLRRNQRHPRAFTRGLWEERPGSRELPVARIGAPRRRSSVSSKPSPSGPLRASVCPPSSNQRRAPARLDQTARGKTRCYCWKALTAASPRTRQAAVTVR
jgi:hypothetical protein